MSADETQAHYDLIAEAIIVAREVQEYIWGEQSSQTVLDEPWQQMFYKRADAIMDIDFNDPYWKANLRKRLLQQAALTIKLMYLLDRDRLRKDA